MLPFPRFPFGEEGPALRSDCTDRRQLDASFMRLALFAAQLADPSPNPPVGAVVAVRDQIVAVANHERAGQAHAEVLALEAAGIYAREGTLYVTLEPCNHWGKTPPCVDAILRAGIRRVVYGCPDPNPNVTGGGADVLLQHGVVVECGPWESRAHALIQRWRATLSSQVRRECA